MAFVNNDNKGISDEDNSPKSEGLGHTLSGTTSAVDVSMFGESNGLADVTLVVEGRRIPVTKAVLAFSSPVFLAMFQSDFQEKEKSEIPLPDKKLQTFVHFLKCIYPNTKEQVTAESVYEVVYLANEYQVEHLKTVCEQVLLKEMSKWEDPTTPDCCMEVYRHLVIAETLQLEELQARCIGIASEGTQADREAAAKVHAISEKSEKIIDKKAIRNLEINTSDLKDLMKGIGGDNFETVKNFILEKNNTKPQNKAQNEIGFAHVLTSQFGQSNPFPFPFKSSPPPSKPWAENIRNLRLLYQYAPASKDLKRVAIKAVRKDKGAKVLNTSFKEEFDLLPEKIKHDIRGREVMEY
ncbi:uncharacterized protein LOC128224115 isoform X2 [Mya arenaria]|uniref:uncharacterized protein LOC128224115 isoform X2 n=1 Tax=Mya arenaria TaxID=6604 RepID=UPI0022E4A1A5|nr:uncharacterized protein LOC128224115 isoform X2 [Mya arenaria]